MTEQLKGDYLNGLGGYGDNPLELPPYIMAWGNHFKKTDRRDTLIGRGETEQGFEGDFEIWGRAELGV